MWDSHQFKNYLKNIGYPKVFDKIIYPGMKQCITGAILLNQDNLDTRKNSFELYGADFMLTEDFQPWLIEINAKPALFASTPVTARMCPQVLEDLVKVIIDVPHKLKANTGTFELLYKQEIPKLPKVNADKLKLEGTPLTRDYFCDPKITENTNLTTMSMENVKLDEIQDYISKVNTEMNNALMNLLRIINKERSRRKQLTYGLKNKVIPKQERNVEGKGKIELINAEEAVEQSAVLEEISNDSPTNSESSLANNKDDSNVSVDKNSVLGNIVNFLKKYGTTT